MNQGSGLMNITQELSNLQKETEQERLQKETKSLKKRIKNHDLEVEQLKIKTKNKLGKKELNKLNKLILRSRLKINLINSKKEQPSENMTLDHSSHTKIDLSLILMHSAKLKSTLTSKPGRTVQSNQRSRTSSRATHHVRFANEDIEVVMPKDNSQDIELEYHKRVNKCLKNMISRAKKPLKLTL
mmetsp:Transcript_805/g.674  ORF Transcript_805/g.674 Transcript_805/m.674 type:complete len:185 (+) Transcript_805:285-839(+)